MNNILWVGSRRACLLIGLLFMGQAVAGPPPIQTYYIPGSEEQIRATFLAGDSGSGSTIVNVISIAPASSNTVIYYDQKENGYETDLANPVSIYSPTNLAGTQIWGDNNPANGMPPGYSTDLIVPGKTIVLKNEITLPVSAGQIYFDCGDKIASTKAIAVAFVLWPTDPGPVLADALGVYDTRAYGTNFIAPVGETTLTELPYAMFNYSALAVMASQDGTRVQVDTNGDGVIDLSATIDQGQSYMASSNGGIRAGAEVKASKPVQVHLFTDRRNSRMQSRWFSLDSRDRWSTNYYSPIGTTDSSYPAGVILFNPYTNSLSVAYQTRSGSGVNTVPAKSTLLFSMPSDSGAIFTANRPFTGVNVMDVPTSGQGNNGDSYDWGCSLQPASALTSAILVGYGAGSADYSGNGSPAWVMALGATTLYVDYDGNPATGALVDPRGARYDTSYAVTSLQSKRIFNPSSAHDQTGMRVYTVDGVKIVGAWGEDPDTASSGNPYLDAGYTIFGLPEITCSKSAQLTNDFLLNGAYDPGDEILYTLRVNNEGGGDLQNVVVNDPLPSNTTYVAGTVTLNGAPIADNTAPPSRTPYPLDEGGLSMGTMPGFSTVVILFRVKIATALPVSVSNILNKAQVTSLYGEVTVKADITVQQADLELTKLVSRSVVPQGSNFTYTVTVTNKGPNRAVGVTVRDLLPAGVTFVSAGTAYNPTNGIWTVGALNVGASTSLQIVARSLSSGTFTNAAEVWTSAQCDPDSLPGNGVATEDDYGTAVVTSLHPSVDLVKTANGTADGAVKYVNAGTPVVYEFKVTNNGNTSLANLRITDNKLGAVGTWPGPIAPGASFSLFATNSGVTVSVTNIGTVWGTPVQANGTPLAGFADVQDTDDAVVLLMTPKIGLVKTAGAAADGAVLLVASGRSVAYTYRVTNLGGTHLTNVVVTDDKLGAVGRVYGILPPGASTSLTATLPAATRDVTNLGTVQGTPCFAAGQAIAGLTNVIATDTAVIDVISPKLDLEKTVSADGRVPGEEQVYGTNGTPVTYTFVLRNNGDVTLTNVTLVDNDISFTHAFGTLAVNQARTVTVNRVISGHLLNTAEASGYDPNGDVYRYTDTAEVFEAAPAIKVVKTAATAADGEVLFVRTGSDVTYQFALSNTGDTFLTNVVVTDDVLGLVGVIAGPVAPGWSGTLSLTHSNVMADVVNVATANGTPCLGSGLAIPGMADVSAQDDAEVRIAVFTLNKEDLPDPVVAGQTLSYTIWVANPSPNPVTGLVVTEQYPAFFTFLSAAPAPTSGNNSWELGTLQPGALVPIVINGTVSAATPAGRMMTNRVMAVSINAGSLTTSEVTRVVGDPKPGQTVIRVTKRDNADPVKPGDTLVYTIRVENFGPETASNVVVTEAYDPLFQFTGADPAPAGGSDNVWSLGNLASNAFVEIKVSGIVSTTATNGTVLLDRAGATAENAPPSRDDELTLVGLVPPPNITKTADLDPVQGGQILTYTLTIVNDSTSGVLSNVTVVECYDPLFSYQSSTPAPMAGTQNAWYLGDLPPGFTTNILISGKVSRKAMREDVLFNTAELFSDSGSRTVHLTTRVINTPPIPVTLVSLRAVDVAGGVKVKWETATEFENLGFNVYRAASLTGKRIKLNAALIPGSDSSDGAVYKFIDAQAQPGKTYYYWLEEVAWNFKTTTFGPCVRPGEVISKASAAASSALGVFGTTAKGGLYRITYAALQAAGVPVGTVDAETLAVRINGQPVPIFVRAEGATLKPDDFLLFYAPRSIDGLACEVTLEKDAARMTLADARPVRKAGNVYVDQAGKRQRVKFATDPAVVRYLLQGFTGDLVWVVDCTDPSATVMLAGYACVVLEDGQTGVYLSYSPESGSADCLAVQDDAVMDVSVLNAK